MNQQETEVSLLSRVTCWYPTYKRIMSEFDEWADGTHGNPNSTYDKDFRNDTRYPAPRVLYNIMAPFIDKKHLEIIDFACGTGLSGKPFIEAGHNLDGIDFSTKMLKKAEERYRKVLNINLVDATLDTVKDYDIALCIGTLGQYIPSDFLLPIMKRTVKEGALIGLTIEYGDKDIIFAELKQNGLVLLDSKEELGYDAGMTARADFLYVVAKNVSI